ncbi:FN3 domain-containing metallophosphoesterase family protein [Alistipes sp. cv1]|nr:FN3 domain-containing metallophosphoesterase family protein [Alistipes sp. cv1]
MKKIVFCFLGLLAVLYTASAQSYTFNHGPYLQELSEHAVTFVFTTSDKGFSWVEVKPDGGEAERHYTVRNGLRDAYNTFNVIRVENLRPDTRYQYRLCSKQIADFQPYKVTFGDSIVSPWRRFSTPDPKATACSFIALSDMHQQPDKLGRLLNQAGVGSADMIFYVGDMMNYYDNEETPFRSFIDKSVELFASEKPFVLVRGNHETRGNMAREYARYVPKSSGKYYGAYRVGDIMFIVLDCGEDKPDDFWVYAGLTDFDGYRTEQAAWFGELIRSKAYKSAKWRIVMNHFPPLSHMESDNPERHGIQDITDKFLPLYNQAKIDLMISGHTHAYEFMSPDKYDRLTFPVIVNSTESVARIDIDGRTLKAKVTDTGGNTLKEFTISKYPAVSTFYKAGA